MRILIAILLMFCLVIPADAEGALEQQLIEQLVMTYGVYETVDTDIIEQLSAINLDQAAKWQQIMQIWQIPPIVNATLPDDLPTDETLALVALGFQLNPDGTMRDELIHRLEVVKMAAKQYPKALIVCTGGGTATNDPAATEAGRMAEWLIDAGIDPARVIVEDNSLTTAQNAIYSFDILEQAYPQVTSLAVISSDYHIETGVLLFSAEAILRNSPVAVISNASYKAPNGNLSRMFQAGALIELSGDVETAFEIYYDTYDIHELPEPKR